MVGLLLILLLVTVAVAVYFYRRHEAIRREYQNYQLDVAARIDFVCKQSVKQSRAVTLGQISQHFAPLLPGFNYHPKDVQWIGGLVDFIAFDGLSNGTIERVVFLDVKTGPSAQLSGQQRQLRDAITTGLVEWETYRMPMLVADLASLEVPPPSR
jgi:predicted Holliday junction resolvase-like endonuclease